jgi:hypothetical protein
VIRRSLGQSSELVEDLEELNNELHIRCTPTGSEYSKIDLPKGWLTEGLSIKIVSPFRLRPWRDKSNSNLQDPNPKEKRDNSSFLSIYGTETESPSGPPLKEDRSTLFFWTHF